MILNKKKIFIFVFGVLIIVLLIFILKETKIIEDKKKSLQEKKKIQKITKIDIYKDGVPLKWIRIKPVEHKKYKKKIKYTYLWYINDVQQEIDSSILNTDKLKKGDKIYCKIFPKLGKQKLKTEKTETIIYPNSPPIIKYHKIEDFTIPGTFKYQIKAEDPDGDELTYELLSPLDKDIFIDHLTGEIVWEISESLLKGPPVKINNGSKLNPKIEKKKGNERPVLEGQTLNLITIKFKVTDSDGAIKFGDINLDLSKGKELAM